MIQWLVILGLIIIPFAHLEHVCDQKFLKEYIGLGLALAISLYALYTHGLKSIKNKWILFVLGSMLASTAFVPPSGLILGHADSHGTFVYSTINIENLWNYKPILIGLIYFLMVCAIAYTDLDEILIMKIISWIGFLMALVVIAQKFGFQEFWRIQNDRELGLMRHPELMGFMAQYTLVAAFMALCQMAALFTRKFWFAIVMGIAICMTTSHFGIICIPIAWLLFSCRNYRGNIIIAFVIIFIGMLFALYSFRHSDDGRFNVWLQIYHDVTHPVFDNRLAESQGFTGFGAGAYSVFFPILHQSVWAMAHNDFWEFLFNNGIFGLGMLLKSITVFYSQCFEYLQNKTIQFCLFTFTIICILANGTFIWQLGWGQFYTAVIVGLAYSAIRKEDEYVIQAI